MPVNHIEGRLQAPLTAEVGVAAVVEASELCKSWMTSRSSPREVSEPLIMSDSRSLSVLE